ncbi:MAG: GNAT family protein [Alphaproteobacteria bacterium]|jgi:ribosomal-protein-alanine N-acetyltransferase|nr:GNAT family protein [Alphaproteobacteria bacterium]
MPLLRGRKVYLRPPQPGDWADWARLRAESREFLTPWEPTWAADELTRNAFRRRLRRYGRDAREGYGYAFFVFRASDDSLLGGLTLSNVRRGVTQSCSLGYWMGKPHAGQGYMTDALGTVLQFVFDSLGLHRLEAACLPSNERSKAVLRRVGFDEEGLARQYLKINGTWRDHVLFALLASDPRPTVNRPGRRRSNS